MFKLKILTFSGWYLPGYRGGGPIRTLANMVERLGDEFGFKIVTSDRDSQDTKPYSGIMINRWNNVGKAEVFYMSPNRRSLQHLRRIFCATEYDVLYLNSFFSPYFTIKPLLLRRLRLIPDRPLVIAPRGELSLGALGLKRLKKRVYIAVSKAFGLYQDVVWQASSEHEEVDIRNWFGNDVRVIIAPDLPPQVYESKDSTLKREKTKGVLNMVFLSRISRKKNLRGALEMLKGLKGQVKFNIYGPIEDRAYWMECQKIISSLPENIKVQYYGEVEHGRVVDVMNEHDLFFLPTFGENFGHAILEAFCSGCPVLVSDRTPWRGLEEKDIGWDLPLNQPELFRKALQTCVDMDNLKHMEWSKRTREYGFQVTKDNETVERNRSLLQGAIGEI